MKKIYLALCISASLVLSGCGGGESSSDNNSSVQTPIKKKAARDPLMAQDVYATYYDNGQYQPIVNNIFGEVSYRLADDEPNDIIMINKHTGLITYINPGDVTIVAEDTSTVYQSSSDTFTVHIEQATNSDLHADYQAISTLSTKKSKLSVHGQRGKLTFSVAPESQHLLTIDSMTGEMEPLGEEGYAEVIIHDEGNRRYLPTSTRVNISIKAVKPGELKFANIETPFTKKLVIQPQKISDSNEGTLHYALASQDKNSKVLNINPTTGVMDVLKDGIVTIHVTQTFDKGYDTKVRNHYFIVEVKKGTRPKLEVDNANFTYEANKVLPVITRNAMAEPHYSVVSRNGVLEIDRNTGQPKIVGVGTETIKALDYKDNRFAQSETTFEYTINPGQHPGLTQDKLEYVYSEDNLEATKTLKLAGQQGRLSITTSNANVVAVKDRAIVLQHAGHAVLSVTDDGGNLYHAFSKDVPVTVLPAPHPQMTVTDINAVYANNLCIPVSQLNAKNVKGSLVIKTDGDESVVKFDKQKSCFSVLKAGSANFTATSSGNGDYKASNPVSFSVAISPADSRISIDGRINEVYRPGKVTIQPPKVIGSKGKLSYAIASSASQKDVVSVDAESGVMTILNAGSTLIKVTDAGTGSYKPSFTTYSVRINQAPNPLTVDYPLKAYEKGDVIAPVVKDAHTKVTYKIKSYNTVVSLVDGATGKLAIKSAGDYDVEVAAVSNRNYQGKYFKVSGKVSKAPHPGIKSQIDNLYYQPEMEVNLNLPAPLGKRSYNVSSKAGAYRSEYLKIENPNVATVKVMNYSPIVDIDPLIVNITEEESVNHFALTLPNQSGKRVRVLPPQPKTADRDIELPPTFSIIDSNLNNKIDFKNLEETQVRFAGAIQLPSEDPQSKSIRLLVVMKPVNLSIKEAIKQGKQASVTLKVKRYEGCATSVNILNLPSLKPVDMTEGKVCSENEATNRYLTYTVADLENLEKFDEGEWETVAPFVSYYYSQRPFIPGHTGGFYEPENSNVIRKTVNVASWDRMTLKVTK